MSEVPHSAENTPKIEGWGFRDKSLSQYINSLLHDERGSDPVNYVIEQTHVVPNDVSFLSERQDILFARFKISEIDTVDEFIKYLEDQGVDEALIRDLRNNGMVGYGTGIANLGCAPINEAFDLINQKGIADNSELSLFLPVSIPTTEE